MIWLHAAAIERNPEAKSVPIDRIGFRVRESVLKWEPLLNPLLMLSQECFFPLFLFFQTNFNFSKQKSNVKPDRIEANLT